jgi:hypothetical protein
MTDEEHWGVSDRWDLPADGFGDCEDYQLLKRRLLAEAGLPRRAMRMTVVVDETGDGHAVLIVRTDRGDVVLDNRTDAVLPWHRTGYAFVKRESQSSAAAWVSLGRRGRGGGNRRRPPFGRRHAALDPVAGGRLGPEPVARRKRVIAAPVPPGQERERGQDPRLTCRPVSAISSRPHGAREWAPLSCLPRANTIELTRRGATASTGRTTRRDRSSRP